ncbi:MAG TPA: FHA domain-containing protein, partial [Ideonella sp.]|nr:FHA domain-containing protein [Ideonella sp.]
MITFDVVAYNGSALAQSLGASFDELGGTIGRADTNQLVLPDPERTVSRVHAQVVFRNGAYAVIDRGSNPIAVNGRPLGNGQEAVLRGGDELQVGGYVIRVALGSAVGSAAAAADPFADFGFGTAPAVSAAPRVAPARPPAAALDPLAAFGGAPAAPSAPAGAPAGGIPDDWNPFAPDAPASAAPAGRPGLAGGNLGLDAGAAA